MIKDNLYREMQILGSRIKENKFICLKEYPNKYLVGKSKIIHFQNNNDFFDERCMLFIEYTYLLLKVQMESSTVFITKNIFINHFGEIYYFYTFDEKHQNKMVKITHGNLLQNIIGAFYSIFLKEGQEIKDYQYHNIYLKTVNSLIGYLQQLKQKSDKYYYEAKDETKCNYVFDQQPSRPYPLLVHLQNSDMFKEYNYPIKYNAAILAKGIIDNSKNQIKIHYIELSHQYYLLVRDLDSMQSSKAINKSVGSLYLRLFHFLKILQKSRFLKISVSEIDFSYKFQAVKEDEVGCELSLQSNVKNEVRINQTSQEQSSESSMTGKELTKEERDKYNRNKQYMQSLFIFKNNINFNIKMTYKKKEQLFLLEVDALSLWTVEEIYFTHLYDFWAKFANSWFHAYTNQEIDFKIGDFKFDMFHKNKNVGIRTKIRVGKKQNLIEQFVIIYDRILIVLLLLEHSLKKLFKLGFFIYEFNKRSLEEMSQPVFLQNKIMRLKLALSKYTEYYNELVKMAQS